MVATFGRQMKAEKVLIDLDVNITNLRSKMDQARTDVQRAMADMQQSIEATKADFFPKKNELKQQEVQLRESMQSIEQGINEAKDAMEEMSTTQAGTQRQRWTQQEALDYHELARAVTEGKQVYKEYQEVLKQVRHQSMTVNKAEAARIEQIKNKFNPAIKQGQRVMVDHKTKMDELSTSASEQRNAVKDLALEAKKADGKFQAWALSLMFFGMNLRRLFDIMWQSGKDVFQNTMHSVDDTVTSFDRLDGSLDYLKFSVGQALEPLAEALVPIVDKFTQWAKENPGFLRSIAAVSFVVGSLFLLIGQGVLAFTALRTAVIRVKMAYGLLKEGIAALKALKLKAWVAGIITKMKAWKASFVAIKGKKAMGGIAPLITTTIIPALKAMGVAMWAALGPWGVLILAITAIIAGAVHAWRNNIGGFRDFVIEKVLDPILSRFVGMLGLIGDIIKSFTGSNPLSGWIDGVDEFRKGLKYSTSEYEDALRKMKPGISPHITGVENEANMLMRATPKREETPVKEENNYYNYDIDIDGADTAEIKRLMKDIMRYE